MVVTNLHRRVSASESAVDIARMGEPTSTAALLVLFGLLLAGGVLSTRASERSGVPAVLVFLGVGMLAGSDGLLGIAFEFGQRLFVGGRSGSRGGDRTVSRHFE